MSKPQEGDLVTVCYIGKLDNGEVFSSVEESQPISLTIGNSEAPPTLEVAIKEMEVGSVQKVRVPPEEGYGPRTKDLLQTLDKDSFGENIEPKPGMILSLKVNKDGEDHQVPATVIEIDGDEVTVDYNHPLAGHHLTYEVKLLSIG